MRPSSSRRPSIPLWPAILPVIAISLASCASPRAADQPPKRPTNWAGHTKKSDAKPHAGVSRAHHYPVHGIDVSKYQAEIDWVAARNAGVTFAFIKATEGGDHLDEKFFAHWTGARLAGVLRGAYHFMYWCRPASEQARWFRQHVPAERDALPPVLDLEWNGHSKTCPKKLSPEAARAKIDLILREMEKHTGKRPIIYTDIVFHREVMVGHYPGHHYWLRSVAAEPHEKYESRSWTFWQFTATGRVPGIKGDVDRNAFVGSLQQLQALAEPPK